MITAKNYPVNFPYGATSAPYSRLHPHRGDDRACPSGTPIVIGSTTIGLTGATGKVIGAHLHIQEWKGDYANTRKPQNAFKTGVVTNIDPNGTQGDGSFGKFITIRSVDGWSDSYCHLSEINVKVGQVLKSAPKEDNVAVKLDLSTAKYLAYTILGRDGKNGRPDAFTDPKTIADLQKNHVGQSLDNTYIVHLFRSKEASDYRKAEGL